MSWSRQALPAHRLETRCWSGWQPVFLPVRKRPLRYAHPLKQPIRLILCTPQYMTVFTKVSHSPLSGAQRNIWRDGCAQDNLCQSNLYIHPVRCQKNLTRHPGPLPRIFQRSGTHLWRVCFQARPKSPLRLVLSTENRLECVSYA